jgi:hypothetical protein
MTLTATKNLVEKSIGGKECCANLKIIEPSPQSDDFIFYTLLRKSDNAARFTYDKKNNGEFIKYGVGRNTGFTFVLNKDSPDDYFFSNDMAKDYPNMDHHTTIWKGFYDSCIVVPIKGTSLVNKRHGKMDKDGKLIVGFLCIDTLGGGFSVKYDLVILRQLAYFLYIMLEVGYLMKEFEHREV